MISWKTWLAFSSSTIWDLSTHWIGGLAGCPPSPAASVAFVGVVASAVDPLDAASGRLDNSESAPNPVFGENHGFTTKENTKAREVVKGQNKTDTLENWTKWVFVASAHKERWC